MNVDKQDNDLEALWKKNSEESITDYEIERQWNRLHKDIKQRTLKKSILVSYGIKRIIAASVVILLSTVYVYNTTRTKYIVAVNSTSNTKEIILPDSSLVVLSKGSSLQYPVEFTATSRNVTLNGEAFFKVVKNTKAPFFVHTANTTTKVVGTSFNIQQNLLTQTDNISLFTGAVEVSANKKIWNIVPGQQFQWSTTNKKPSIVSFDKDIVAAWKLKTIHLKDESLIKVFKILESKYKVTIELKDEKKFINEKVTLIINNNHTIDELLEIISITNTIRFTKNSTKHEKRITISKK